VGMGGGVDSYCAKMGRSEAASEEKQRTKVLGTVIMCGNILYNGEWGGCWRNVGKLCCAVAGKMRGGLIFLQK